VGRPDIDLGPDVHDLIPHVRTIPLEHQREQTAKVITYVLLAVFCLTAVGPPLYWLVRGADPPAGLIEYVKYIVPTITGLLGATVGFYFSQKRLH
jgi:hypothetical protein